MQHCPTCKQILPLECFAPCRRGKKGERCRACQSAAWKKKYKENKSHFTKQRQKWAAKNRKYLTAKNREWREENLAKHFIHTSRQRAKVRGQTYELTAEDITPFPTACFYCSRPLTIKYGKRHDASPSIDRLEPKLGYTKQNAVISCWRCNRLKCDMSVAELQALAENVTRVASQRGIYAC